MEQSMIGTTPDKPGPQETLLFENERVRIWELVLPPGEACNWHTHSEDHILIIVDGASTEATLANDEVHRSSHPDFEICYVPKVVMEQKLHETCLLTARFEN